MEFTKRKDGTKKATIRIEVYLTEDEINAFKKQAKDFKSRRISNVTWRDLIQFAASDSVHFKASELMGLSDE